MKVMFVCSGNICRSPMAHALFEQEAQNRDVHHEVQVESCGTTSYHVGDGMDARARNELAKNGISFNHRARHFSSSDLDEYDLILTMDRTNYRSVVKMADKERAKKVRMFREYDPSGGEREEVPDPYYGGGDGFAEVYTIIERTVGPIMDSLPVSK